MPEKVQKNQKRFLHKKKAGTKLKKKPGSAAPLKIRPTRAQKSAAAAAAPAVEDEESPRAEAKTSSSSSSKNIAIDQVLGTGSSSSMEGGLVAAYNEEEKQALRERRAVLPDSKYLTAKEIKVMNMNLNEIKNSALRSELYERQRMLREKLSRKRRADVQKLGLGKIEPKTQEDLREKDDTMVVDQNAVEVMEEQETDEFSQYFGDENAPAPKILITTGLDETHTHHNPSKTMLEFIYDLVRALPNAFYVRRRGFTVREVSQFCINQGFTDLLIINDHCNRPFSLIHAHLPEGPTAVYRISNAMSRKQIEKNPFRLKSEKLAESSDHAPELILNSFTTRIGYRTARMLSALFPKVPEFVGRRVITFHNQRDFIFFRHHRYEFDDSGNRCALQEIGPRFTLRLSKMQLGLFDEAFGSYEWFHTADMDTSRRRFFM